MVEEEQDLIEELSGHINIYAHANKKNPRNQSCPRCGRENMLTPEDILRNNVCKICDKELKKERVKMIKQWEREWELEDKKETR